jgi:hypothetical protein
MKLIRSSLLFLIFLAFAVALLPTAAQAGQSANLECRGKTYQNNYIGYYKEASNRFHLGQNGDVFLASVHCQESRFSWGRNSCPKSAGGGSAGPFGFIRSTWERHAFDGNGDNIKSRCSFRDSVLGAAHKFKADGAPKNWRRALCIYYGACADSRADYANDVIKRAREYARVF